MTEVILSWDRIDQVSFQVLFSYKTANLIPEVLATYSVFLLLLLFYHRRWIENSKLKEIKFKVVEFNPMVLKGKIRQDASRPELLQPVSKLIPHNKLSVFLMVTTGFTMY